MTAQNFRLQTLRSLLQSGRLIPWRLIADWQCQACGECCTRYVVELKPHEWIELTRAYGYWAVNIGVSRVTLRRRPDGSCVFLYRVGGHRLCGLQAGFKPSACRTWPFQPFEKPVFGFSELAEYRYGRRTFYVYVVPECRGLTFGMPTRRLAEKVIPEILEIKFGRLTVQRYSTSQVQLHPYPLTLIRV